MLLLIEALVSNRCYLHVLKIWWYLKKVIATFSFFNSFLLLPHILGYEHFSFAYHYLAISTIINISNSSCCKPMNKPIRGNAWVRQEMWGLPITLKWGVRVVLSWVRLWIGILLISCKHPINILFNLQQQGHIIYSDYIDIQFAHLIAVCNVQRCKN